MEETRENSNPTGADRTGANGADAADGGGALIVRGAREHNLRDVDVELPRDRLIVVTGLSGSGKSSLAFDTIYAEGQRRYVESLSAYARQFLGVMEKPDVDVIEGLSPAIAIEQRTAGGNPRSTVGTVTEIYDYLRLLWARAGTPHCPSCGRPVRPQSPSEIAQQILGWPAGARIEVRAPLVRGRKGEFRDLFERTLSDGFVRARVDGELVDLSDPPLLNRRRNHDISVVVDRLVVRASDRERLSDSVATALRMADGVAEVALENGDAGGDEDGIHLFSERYACPGCGLGMPELEPRQFSFNSPFGACQECDGLGHQRVPNADLIVGGDQISILEGVLLPLGTPSWSGRRHALARLARKLDFDLNTVWGDLDADQQEAILYGDTDVGWEGAVAATLRRYHDTTSERVRLALEEYMTLSTCLACDGGRLRPESRAVTLEGLSLPALTAQSVAELRPLLGGWLAEAREAGGQAAEIRVPILKEVVERLEFLDHVGLGYLTLARSAGTLSGGEAQRIRLATQIGSRLVGVLYVLDEPSIGLHPRDNRKLLQTLGALRDLGNTVLVVEHDELTIRRADHIVDMGPGAGREGGEVVVSGDIDRLLADDRSLTAAYLRGEREIAVPERRRPPEGGRLVVRGAREHNLRAIDVEFPLGTFICVTGVSGSGKSTLVEQILYRRLAREIYRSKLVPGAHDAIEGIDLFDKVIDVDQSPIGRTPRSNPATYTGLFTPIRELFARLPESNIRGYAPGRFSFNVKGGRCEPCRGDGLVKIEMHFLPDVYVPCDICRGRRYNRETLEVLYRGRSIADVLAMSVDEALEFFDAVPSVKRRLGTLSDVGLGYVTLGQPATTLSGGEAQRVKLATELAKTSTGRTIYILDEPTTGLHFEDVRLLLRVLHRLADRGNTIIVIEHHMDVVKTADWVIDMGPEGGAGGGLVVAEGPPELVAATPGSHTGRHLASLLPESSRESTPKSSGTLAI
ncbi:excinuclease ABC subunit UvrA [Candidatus Palauibacter polyketidifaciens]|uniref:excinuclease ABC subunit UvrA n=1 Tax=Candidatus Palauibacter polyketidifaciens TaxID=3056740 RepID=UPI00238F2AAF|nr:excinuclease ABC subunit UvrA [Candidatus Palauibacter polyketidifaciens]MDE2719793.1 excinuclease ABC subunit UvrA [Candidatus Palauibacter polyketidifaciens]